MAPSALLARRVRSARAALLVCCAGLAIGCDGEVVNLGSSERLQTGGEGGSAGTAVTAGAAQGGMGTWGAPVLVLAEEGFGVANATFDADMQDMFYTHQPVGGDTLATIHRAEGPDFRNGNAVMFTDLADTDEVSPAVSADGKELWLGMLGVDGNTDIYLSKGEKDAWSKPALVAELSSPDGDDVPRPPAVDGSIMPLSSKRHAGEPNLYQIYFSTRADASSPWRAPNQDSLEAVNSPSFQSADGFLTEDALELYFASTRGADGHHDLYVAARPSVDVSFGEPQALVDLKTTCAAPPDKACEERMPWLSPDRSKLYFASNRSGEYALYVSSRMTP